MKRMIASLWMGLVLAGPAAQADEPVSSQEFFSEGVVRKIDKSAGKVTLRHGPLKNLGMPPMTMVFRVKDPTWLEQMKPGDRIRFVAEQVNGAFTVVRYEPISE